MQIIVDRIEGSIVIVELPNKKTIPIPKEFFPKNVKEGDVIEIKVNEELTAERKKNITNKMTNLFE